jgi:uridine kinase
MILKLIISISGRICSGKSFLANQIKNKFGLPIASFGGYLSYFCEQSHFETDRKTLQDTGEALEKENPQEFLSNVISHFIGNSNKIIVEGIRHKSMLDSSIQLSEKHLSFFLDTDIQTRYHRYCNRNHTADTIKTYEHFVTIDNHFVELEIESLKDCCDFILNGNENNILIIGKTIDKMLL